MNYISQSNIGAQIFRFEKLTSTNEVLREFVENKSALHGAVVVSKFQTNGRGQITNTWESEADKNLLLSIYITPKTITATEQVLINLFVSLSVFDFLNSFFPGKIKIKWPNDIYFDDQKICGILIENNIQGNTIKSSVIGVGININQRNFLSKQATSLAMISNMQYDLDELLDELLSCFNLRFEELSLQLKSKLTDDYLKVMYRINMEANYRIEDKIVCGKIIGIDAFGRLKLLIGDELKLYSFKEISYE